MSQQRPTIRFFLLVACIVIMITVVIIQGCSLFAPSGPNFAYRKPVYQSSSQKWVDTGQMAVDGRSNTRWTSRPNGTQWIFVDLGAKRPVDRVIVKWDREHAGEFRIEVSNDRNQWEQVAAVTNGGGGTNDLSFEKHSVRYVKLSCLTPGAPGVYSVREFEVYGENENRDRTAEKEKPREALLVSGEKTVIRSGWMMEDADRLHTSAEELSKTGFDDSSWLPAVVPGTALGTFLDNNVLPDPYYADQQYMISESLSTSKFWYRTEFLIPTNYPEGVIWLNFDGINYEADIFVNGQNTGNIKGAFIRGKFDITGQLRKGERNCLAVLIHPVPHPGEVSIQLLDSPGENGGAITEDGPTFISSAGWDWMPTIRGRNIGIWQDVWISRSGPVTVTDPFVVTDLPLPRTDSAALTVKAVLKNHSDETQRGTARCRIEEIIVEKETALTPGEETEIVFSPEEFPALNLKNPRLWWPVNYGDPELYDVELFFTLRDGSLSDRIVEKFGIREVSAENKTPEDPLVFTINGRPILIRGGNWGIDEAMKRTDEKRLRALIRLHRDANLNMIRNWTGQTTQESFYALCDEYGLMVWDDFWMANNSDGPDPADTELFMKNAEDKIKRYRNHPSIVLWCGRNETEPPPEIDRRLGEALKIYDSTRRYQRLSDFDGVTGNGPYSWQEAVTYYSSLAKGFSTEIGLPCVPSAESVRAMIPEAFLWKENDMWGVHDFTNGNMKSVFYSIGVTRQFDKSSSIEEFSKKAQMVNMESYKAIYEAWGNKMWHDATGVLLWMTNPAWPSLIFQLYDYYLEPTAAYFGAKKACEPVHILWDRSTDFVTVTNTSRTNRNGLSATATLLNLDGTVVSRNFFPAFAPANKATRIVKIFFPARLSEVSFIKLELRDARNKLLSENFYWRGKEAGVYRALNEMKQVELDCSAVMTGSDAEGKCSVFVKNPSNNVALMIRLKPVKGQEKERILPAFFSDNYFTLCGGENKRIDIEFDRVITKDDLPAVTVEGWNIITKEIAVEFPPAKE